MSDSKWNSSGVPTFADDTFPTDREYNDTITFGSYPIGAVIGWAKSFTSVPSIPQGWKECDGTSISDSESPMNGQVAPSMNSGTQRFLRGADTSGGTGGAETHSHLQGSGGVASNATHALSTESNLPPYYEIVWVIRIK